MRPPQKKNLTHAHARTALHESRPTDARAATSQGQHRPDGTTPEPRGPSMAQSTNPANAGSRASGRGTAFYAGGRQAATATATLPAYLAGGKQDGLRRPTGTMPFLAGVMYWLMVVISIAVTTAEPGRLHAAPGSALSLPLANTALPPRRLRRALPLSSTRADVRTSTQARASIAAPHLSAPPLLSTRRVSILAAHHGGGGTTTVEALR